MRGAPSGHAGVRGFAPYRAGMEFAGMGTTIVFVLAALIWLAYLVPVWLRRREYAATERNAIRLQQTLRIMAESAEVPDEVHVALDARSIAQQERVRAKEQRLQQAIERAAAVAKARELDDQIKAVEREVRAAVAGSISRRARLRRTRLACTAMLLVSLGVGVVGALTPSMTLLLALAGVVATLAIIGLAMVNRSGAQLRAVAAQEAVLPRAQAAVATAPAAAALSLEVEPAFASRTWTPVPVPPQRANVVPRPGVEEPGEHERAQPTRPLAPVIPIQASFDELVGGRADTVEEDAVAAVRASAHALVRSPKAPVPSRFQAMGVVDDDAEGIDIGAAFRRRVG